MTDDLVDWIKEEQASLWHDLYLAQRLAADGVWSIGCSDNARRIVTAARLVGPTPWGDVPWKLVVGGVYDAVLTAGGIPVPERDETEYDRSVGTMAKAGFGISPLEETQLAAAVRKIQGPHETAQINGTDE